MLPNNTPVAEQRTVRMIPTVDLCILPNLCLLIRIVHCELDLDIADIYMRVLWKKLKLAGSIAAK